MIVFDTSSVSFPLLEETLKELLVGRTDLGSLPVKTRSKRAKELVCEVLGFPVPKSFPKTSPRLPALNADVYVQTSNNMQVWNQEVDDSVNYIVIVMKGDLIHNVKVLTGADLAKFDRTGTLTTKYQATRTAHSTASFIDRVSEPHLITTEALYRRIQLLRGIQFRDPGPTQDRARGRIVHSLITDILGISDDDNGQFPDIPEQAIEVKLQLSSTIDLGKILPTDPIARDVRYVVVYADTNGLICTMTDIVVVHGRDFFSLFTQTGGKVSNAKIQLKLPKEWFL
jgi:hypothetical protein